MHKPLIENMAVRVSVAVFIVVFVSGIVAGEVAWKVSMSHRMNQLNTSINHMDKKIVGRSLEGWHRTQMRLWVAQSKLKNPTWEPMAVDEIPHDFNP